MKWVGADSFLGKVVAGCGVWLLALGVVWPFESSAQPAAMVELIVGVDASVPEAVQALGPGGDVSKAEHPLLQDAIRLERVFPATLHDLAAGKKSGLTLPQAMVVRYPAAASIDTLLARWAAQPGVLFVQRNHTYALDQWSDDVPRLDSLDHLITIRAIEAWQHTRGRADVRIGVVDTGLYFEHPDFEGQVAVNAAEDLNGNGRLDAADYNGLDDDGNGYVDDVQGYDFVDRFAALQPGDYRERDPDASEDKSAGAGRGHGTLVSGIIGARADDDGPMAGVAPGSRLVPLRAFGADGLGDDDDIAAAIVYAAVMGLEVVNLSFGDAYYSPLMEAAIAFAVAEGTVVVASGGNRGGDAPHYPSDYEGVIGTAWLTADGEALGPRATYGSGVDLGAPGTGVFTTLMPPPSMPPVEAMRYGRRSGSSVAAPMVAGAAALLRSADPSLSPEAVRDILVSTARDIDEPGWDHRTGGGRLDVARALAQAWPARVDLTAPAQDGGVSQARVEIRGSAAHPLFESYTLALHAGHTPAAGGWTPIVERVERQVVDGVLGAWATEGVAEGPYTLRLQVRLRDGRTVEDRHRIWVDRTAPTLQLEEMSVGLVDGHWGIIVEAVTDDLASLTLDVDPGGRVETVASDRLARRHGLSWADGRGDGGTAAVRIVATNRAGLAAVTETSLTLQPSALNTALFEADALEIPTGYLLPRAVDFDRDGLLELVLNPLRDGSLSDTLAIYEWTGSGFAPAASLVANVIPRDVGDLDGDGLQDLLTQVGGATLVLEQPTPTAYPSSVAFLDTTGLANPFDPQAAFGARLTDLDADGRGEVLVHNTRQWRLLEQRGDGFHEIVLPDNPTDVTAAEVSANEFSEPEALVADFDGDGQVELLVGDNDGDWIRYAATGDDAFEIVWTHETSGYNAGSRLHAADLTGDGAPEAITFTQNWAQPRADGEYEPPFGTYYVWTHGAGDALSLRHRVPVTGLVTRFGAVFAMRLAPERPPVLVVVHPPHLYVLRDRDGALELLYHTETLGEPARANSGSGSLLAPALVAADFDGDGREELIVGTVDRGLYRLVPRVTSGTLPAAPPRWQAAYAQDASTVRLAWAAPGADSVTVMQARPGEAFDPATTTTADTVAIDATALSEYALIAWYGGSPSPLSAPRTVRPHAPARIMAVDYPASSWARLTFSEPLAATTSPTQFRFEPGGVPAALLIEGADLRVQLPRTGLATLTLRWNELRDAEGTPVAEQAVTLQPPSMPAPLYVTQWTLLDPYSVRLTFSAALDPATVEAAGAFTLEPSGVVEEVRTVESEAHVVIVRVAGRPLGATGQATVLALQGLRGRGGETLSPDGSTVALADAATSLADAYVYPNPYRPRTHAGPVYIAGLPTDAEVRILSAQGLHVRSLSDVQLGGLTWDARDEGGARVPSGIYLVYIEAPGVNAVVRKVAVID